MKLVTKLKRRVCTKYRDKIVGRKKFNDKWISGVDSVRTTNVLDHAKSDQHMHAMNLLRPLHFDFISRIPQIFMETWVADKKKENKR